LVVKTANYSYNYHLVNAKEIYFR